MDEKYQVNVNVTNIKSYQISKIADDLERCKYVTNDSVDLENTEINGLSKYMFVQLVS